MYVLGISSYSHDSSCVLLKNGKICALSEEERFNREKHSVKYPERAIEYCLASEGIGLEDVDHIAFFWQPWRELTGNLGHVLRFFPASLRLLGAESGGGELAFGERVLAMSRIGHALQRQFHLRRRPKVHFIEHHLAHAASAFYVSGFTDSAILTVDGRGECSSTMIAHGQGTEIRKIREIRVPHSLGHFYAAITDYLGFKPFSDEWKVMGMSAYGKDTLVKDFTDLLELRSGGEYRLNLSYFSFHTHGGRQWLSEKFFRKFGPPPPKGGHFSQRSADIAFAAQKILEKAGVHLARYAGEITGSKNLCMAGGVALNCLMNRKIIDDTAFEGHFIQPLANDAGASLGAALYLYHQKLRQKRDFVLRHVYWGPEFKNEEIENILRERGAKYRHSVNIALDAAHEIASGKVVGWFQGRMECGPRALGNRSIVADPTLPEMKDRLNARVKRREGFRPFAPSVLEEKAEAYFQLPKKQSSPYMILVGNVRPEVAGTIPAVTHVDLTARVQTVSRETNPIYWDLIREFERIKGVPLLLNTSFNENEPIVCTPAEAVDCFLRTDLDALAIGDFLVTK